MNQKTYDVWQCSNGLSSPPNHLPKRIGTNLPLGRARILASSTSHNRLDRPCAVEPHDPLPDGYATCPLFSSEGWVNGQAVFVEDGRILPSND